ncbi:hypothetical protein SD81_011320 [Tolypothrix campylonemoides VB511288]|nr:hypothetical protein SD81_011320 [Tolypothrix campylonemoides VB511288]
MKRTKLLLTAVGICLGMIPTLPAHAANGEIACNRLINESGYSVVARQGGEPVYRNGRIVSYRYLYTIDNRGYGRREGYGRGERYGRREGYGRERYGRGEGYGRERYITCVWNARRDSARLITR